MSDSAHRDETITLVPRVKFSPGGLEKALPALHTLVDKMSGEPTFVQCYFHRDLDDSDVLVIYETWRTTRESFGAEEMQRTYRQEYQEAVGELVESLDLMWLSTPFRHASSAAS